MGIDAAVQTSDGSYLFPRCDEDWLDWVSAGRTRNHILGDPILDWLEAYGEARGFQRDDQLSGYDERTDFTPFLFAKGNAFEAAVVAHLVSLAPLIRIANSPADIRSLQSAEETFKAMQMGQEIIHQGVLFDAESRTYGAPDLLVRSDILFELFPSAIHQQEAGVAAPDLGGDPWHYRVVDVKFTTLHLLVSGDLANAGSAPAYKAQLFIANRALGRLQGVLPPVSYLIGRGWEQTKSRQTSRGRSCMELLAPVPQDSFFIRKASLAQRVTDAVEWVRRVRREGSTWSVLPEPSVPELWPNMSNSEDGPWHAAKAHIGVELEELTLLWQVGLEKRIDAHTSGVRRWRDPHCTPTAVGVKGDNQGPILQAILDINRAAGAEPVRPSRILAERDAWRPQLPLEFFVDFETVSDLDDDFSRIPEKGGQPLIFMIGCGHIEGGQWNFACFTATALNQPAEAEIIDAWCDHMEVVRRRLAPDLHRPLVFHWSHAEASTLETAYNSAVNRRTDTAWVAPDWFDYLKRVIKAEPVVTRGAFGFGLKAVAKALHQHGLVKTQWQDGPTDGLGAMVGAWWCAQEAAKTRARLIDIPLMQQIAQYNEVDCRVMMEIVSYLRAHH